MAGFAGVRVCTDVEDRKRLGLPTPVFSETVKKAFVFSGFGERFFLNSE
jgi:hypothetical protein